MKPTVTTEQIGIMLGVIATSIIVWKAAVAYAKSVLLREIIDEQKQIRNELTLIKKDVTENQDDVGRNTERIDKLYDRLIQKNS